MTQGRANVFENSVGSVGWEIILRDKSFYFLPPSLPLLLFTFFFFLFPRGHELESFLPQFLRSYHDRKTVRGEVGIIRRVTVLLFLRIKIRSNTWNERFLFFQR